MSIVHTETFVPAPRPEGDHGRRNLLRVRELSPTTLLVAALGEIDAANSADFFAQLQAHVNDYRQLVVDLSGLDFLGTAGFSALHTINVRCSRLGVNWVLVPGPEVRRVLRVCDAEGALPTADNIVSAVAALVRSPGW